VHAAISKAIDGQRVLLFLLCRNDLPTLLAYLAAIEHNHPVALLDAAIEPEAFQALIDRYRPAAVIGVTEAPDGYQPLALSPNLPAINIHEIGGHPVVADDLALLLSTSGSTGSPKFVRLSRTAIFSNAESIAEALDIGAGERAITSLPIHYSYGLSVVNSHLVRGAQVVLTNTNILEEDYWRLVREHAVTSMAGVPYTYHLLHRLDLEKLDVPSIKTLTQAGGRLDPKLIAHFHRLMIGREGKFYVMYGQTEATARIAILPSTVLPNKLGSAGCAIPRGELHILDQYGAPLPAGEIGEVVYTGDNVMLGYAEHVADLARGDVQQGKLSTGDLGYLDTEGFLFITGRLKRIAKVFGYRINLDEVEMALALRGTVAVTCVDDRILAHCEGWSLDLMAEARAELARQMHIHPSALSFRHVEQLPVLANGKIDYHALSGD
jgi:acyl-coenzyme A synthetase/AMP-(fatty) acid ligase